MECRVSWLGNGGIAFSAETGSGHLIDMDGAPEAGGRNLAPRPMELLLAGAGGILRGFNPTKGSSGRLKL